MITLTTIVTLLAAVLGLGALGLALGGSEVPQTRHPRQRPLAPQQKLRHPS